MFKFLLISFVIIFVLSRIGGFLFRSLFWVLGMRVVEKQMRQQEQYQGKQARRTEGEIRIDYETDKNGRHKRNTSKDADYIDYEEVK